MRRALLAGSICLLLIGAAELIPRLSRPDVAGEVAALAAVHLESTVGRADWLMRGSLPADGSNADFTRSVVLGDSLGLIQLDFEQPLPIVALLLQADHAGAFRLDTSLDGSAWDVLWTIGPETEAGLRTRRLVLPEAVPTRYLRLTNRSAATAPPATLTAFRVYTEVPSEWPEASDQAASVSFPWLGFEGLAIAKLVVGCVGAALLIAVLLLSRGPEGLPAHRVAMRLLVVISLFAGLGWWNFLQFTEEAYGRSYRHYPDANHYYVGSKYFRELGYTDLYRCIIKADVEQGFRRFRLAARFTRDLRTNEFVPTQRLVAESASCKESFSPARWEEFKRDNAWFRGHVVPAAWAAIVADHGFNGTPAWTALGGALAQAVPLSDATFAALVSIDTVLLVVMWLFVWSSFGPLAGAAALIYWGTSLVAGNEYTAGGYLRSAWLFCTVVGVCCLERKRMTIAGFLLVAATLLRVFPGFLVGGVALAALVELIGRRSFSLSQPYRRFAGGALLGLVLLGGGSLIVDGGSEAWAGFVKNTQLHRRTPMFQNMGTQAILHHSDQPELWSKARLTVVEMKTSYVDGGHRVLHTALAVVFLVLLAVAVSGEEPWVAAILGLAWLPFVTDITNYYWTVLLLFALLIPRRPIVGVGFAAVMVAFTALGILYSSEGLGRYYFGSVSLVLFVAWVVVLFARPKLARLALDGES